MDECLFCRIATGEQSADVVHSSDNVVAFRDINPQAPTHILIIPKEHIESARVLRDRNAEILSEIFQAAAHLARAEGVDRTGWRLVTNVGTNAGQSVHHLHFHLLGGRPMGWPPG
ncbi:MAG TPA: histidine triad nucleotide-binding protein [Actinomycetota bacterium]|nr:histidine triad nucleotide-binding protein [Actinomycetota bacterium]